MTNLGNGEWGRKMHYDLLDAVEFAVAKGIANRSQVAIMGEFIDKVLVRHLTLRTLI